MLSMLKGWQGPVEVNGKQFDNIAAVSPSMFENGQVCIKLLQAPKKARVEAGNKEIQADMQKAQEYRITVKLYMTKKSEPGFDFMEKWNNNVPMPLRTMTGTIDKETRGMVHMKLHGVGEAVKTCLRCGRTLTNPVSRHYGIGPECMSKLGIVADIDDVESIKEQLVDVEWEGWVIRSAITEQEEV